MLASGIAGYFLNKSKTVLQPQPIPVFREDPKLLQRIDSFKVVTKVHLYYIDSLKQQISLLKKKHENYNNNIDTLPAPVLYRKITEYYGRKQ